VRVEEFYERVVYSGGCYATNGGENVFSDSFVRCALELTDCQAEEFFLSSSEVRERGHVPCRADEVQGGECGLGEGESGLGEEESGFGKGRIGCTNKDESCKVPEEFVSLDSCTVHEDLTTGEPTWFGHCSVLGEIDYRCVWGEGECDVQRGELYIAASWPDTWLGECRCEHVQTGACKNQDGGYHCAVSEGGCAESDTYVSSLQLKDAQVDCRLCHLSREVIAPSLSPTIFQQPPAVEPSVVERPNQPSVSPSISLQPSFIELRPASYLYLSGIGGIFAIISLIIILFRGLVGGYDRESMRLKKTLKKLQPKPTHTTNTA